MRYTVYLIIGIVFGVVMHKSEAASWYRIFEMFQFKSIHMYGIIGSALVFGVVIVQFIKKFNIKSIDHRPINIQPKEKSFYRYFIGGTIFGLGWALAGACPGPMYVLLGAGFWPLLLVIISALFGTFMYGVLKNKLPH